MRVRQDISRTVEGREFVLEDVSKGNLTVTCVDIDDAESRSHYQLFRVVLSTLTRGKVATMYLALTRL